MSTSSQLLPQWQLWQLWQLWQRRPAAVSSFLQRRDAAATQLRCTTQLPGDNGDKRLFASKDSAMCLDEAIKTKYLVLTVYDKHNMMSWQCQWQRRPAADSSRKRRDAASTMAERSPYLSEELREGAVA